MPLTLIYAVAENGVIGRDGKLPWRLPDDFRHFRAVTMGHPLVMGRKTFQSDSGLLPGRINIVLSRNPHVLAAVEAAGGESARSLEEALTRWGGEDVEIFVIGGAALFANAFPLAHRIWETRVHAHPEGDTRLPAFDFSNFKLAEEREHPADEKHLHAFTIRRWERVL